MEGGVCINDWLIQEGYLTLSDDIDGVIPVAKAPIDWSRTMAWGDGGYYGRLFLNVKGREPEGVIEPSRYDEVRDDLIARFESALGPDGRPLGTKVHKPQDVYPEVRGVAPDLIVYFGDLDWRSVGTVGNPEVFTHENDTGPDGANHDPTGIFVVKGAAGQGSGRVEGMNLVDVGPTILGMYGIDAPEGVVGRNVL
jgi:predicted AlkP superfamily phosphohydrolase/phosphomutase